jgi:hypothetical protein
MIDDRDWRDDMREACLRLQKFLDTFGDLGDCVTQADINDWLEFTSAARTAPSHSFGERAAKILDAATGGPMNYGRFDRQLLALAQEADDATPPQGSIMDWHAGYEAGLREGQLGRAPAARTNASTITAILKDKIRLTMICDDESDEIISAKVKNIEECAEAITAALHSSAESAIPFASIEDAKVYVEASFEGKPIPAESDLEHAEKINHNLAVANINLHAEIERLRAGYHSPVHETHPGMAALADEVMRLRKALEEIDAIAVDKKAGASKIMQQIARTSLSSTERRCQKCGIATKGEEALVNGQIWCHPCADADPADEVMRLRTRLLDAESALSVWEPERSAIYWNKAPTRLKDQL